MPGAGGIGKVTVSCRDESGFLVNRLLVLYLNDAVRTCAVAGVTWVTADTSVREELGHPMGPFELMDLIVGWTSWCWRWRRCNTGSARIATRPARRCASWPPRDGSVARLAADSTTTATADDHVPLEQLAISSQCGFSSALYRRLREPPGRQHVDEDPQWRKLERW